MISSGKKVANKPRTDERVKLHPKHRCQPQASRTAPGIVRNTTEGRVYRTTEGRGGTELLHSPAGAQIKIKQKST